MRPLWDQPGADPVADIAAFIEAGQARALSVGPKEVHISDSLMQRAGLIRRRGVIQRAVRPAPVKPSRTRRGWRRS